MDQSSTPWRVFDAPAASPAGQAGAAPASGAAGAGVAGVQGLPANPVVAIAGIGAAVIVGALAIVVAISGGGGTVAGPETVSASFGDAAAVGGEIVVDVTGAVVAPGVYHLPSGARVGEAIEAAGGFGPRVDAARVGVELNLAATLQDGAQVRVPSRDETAPPGAGPGGGGGGSGGAAGGLVNVNTASQSELEALPGIGPVTATKIIASRETAPFARIEELRERGLVGEATFADIQPLVTVG